MSIRPAFTQCFIGFKASHPFCTSSNLKPTACVPSENACNGLACVVIGGTLAIRVPAVDTASAIATVDSNISNMISARMHESK